MLARQKGQGKHKRNLQDVLDTQVGMKRVAHGSRPITHAAQIARCSRNSDSSTPGIKRLAPKKVAACTDLAVYIPIKPTPASQYFADLVHGAMQPLHKAARPDLGQSR